MAFIYIVECITYLIINNYNNIYTYHNFIYIYIYEWLPNRKIRTKLGAS